MSISLGVVSPELGSIGAERYSCSLAPSSPLFHNCRGGVLGVIVNGPELVTVFNGQVVGSVVAGLRYLTLE